MLSPPARLKNIPAPRRLPPVVLAMLAQVAAILLCGLAAWMAQRLGEGLSLGTALLLQSACAVTISAGLRMQSWWLALQAIFVPALVFALTWQVAPYWYLLAFLLLLSLFWNTFASQVPLYLSRPQVWQTVAEQLPSGGGLRVADLGSGLGGLVHFLAQRHPDSQFHGIETAPLPAWFSKLRTLGQSNSHLTRGNFWQSDLGAFDVVFAYLSPVPMPALWEKAKREMRPGSRFISYRFCVPGVVPSRVVTLQDLGQTKLYIWEM